MHGRTTGLSLLLLLAFLVNMVATVLFSATNWLWLAVFFGVFWGGSLTMMTTAAQALVQSAVDDAVRGRVMALYTMIYRGAPFLGALVIGWLGDRIGLQPAFIAAALLCALPWVFTFAKRHSITLALEGRDNDLDERLLAKSKAIAGVAYEQIVDLKDRAGPLAEKVRDQTQAIAARVKEARLPEKLQAVRKRNPRKDDLT
jgi:MFS family permease